MMGREIPWDNDFGYSGQVGGPPKPLENEPILFVHGNGRDATDWEPHFDYFTKQGIQPNRLWAISFNNTTLTHTDLSIQLEHFVRNLLQTTESNTLSIVSHSLGVTVTRFWLEACDRYNTVTTFIGIAGANHGLNVCGSAKLAEYLTDSHKYKPCQTLGRNIFTPSPIEQLNTTIGETPGNINYYTIRGTQDKFYAGCQDSPILTGAHENTLLEADHEEVRTREDAITLIYTWITNHQP